MRMTLRTLRAAALLAAAALAFASQAQAQVIKPLEVERDANGVDMLSGKIETPLPVLSIPAAPSLSFQRLQDLQPLLSGQLIPGPGEAAYDINVGRASSEHFDCPEEGFCHQTVKGNGSAIVANPSNREFTYYEGGTGREIFFDLQNGPQGLLTSAIGFSFYPSHIRHASGEQLDFAYDQYTDGNGHVWRRPASIRSSTGYTLTLTYQAAPGQLGWTVVASATIQAGSPGNLGPPLAKLTYSGSSVIDLHGRTWTCTNCTNSLAGTSTTTVTALRLPTEGTDALASEAAAGPYGHNNWVTRVTRDGVQWNYAWVADPSQPTTRIDRVTMTGPAGFSRVVEVRMGFNLPSRIDSIRDSLNGLTSYTYGNGNRLTAITYPELNRVEVDYDLIGNITERRQIAKPGSNLANLVERANFPIAAPGCIGADCFRPAWTQDAMGRQTDYTWDAGYLLTRLEPADANGQRRKTINTWSLGRLTRERVCLTNAAGVEQTCGTAAEQVRTIAYLGATPLVLTETRTDGILSQSLTTTNSYDPEGRGWLISSDGPLTGNEDATFYRYDVHGRRTWEIGPEGANGLRIATRTFYRDSDDKVLSTETGTIPDENSGNLTIFTRTDFTIDAVRQPIREAVTAAGAVQTVTDRAFDGRGRLVCTAIRMNPAAFAQMPGACAHTTTGSQGPDRIALNIHDSESRVIQEWRAYGVTTGNGFPRTLQQVHAAYTYSPNGQRTGVTDANGNRAELRYDGHGRQIRWVFPSPNAPGQVNEGDFEAYSYDANGNRTSLRKRDGSTLTFQHDALNRMTVKVVPERSGLDPVHTRDVHYGYDIGNRQTFARFDSASGDGVTNAYDIFGRLTSSTLAMGGITRTLSSLYDAGSRRTRITHPDAQSYTYAHDAAGRLTSFYLGTDTSIVLGQFAYNSRGLIESHIDRPGSYASYGYDPVGRPSNLTHDFVGAAGDVVTGLAYNPASQITQLARTNDAYAASAPANVTRAYTPNGLNQYSAVGGTAHSYDANGNLTSDGTRTYGYDVENRLVSASSGVTLRYDPLGRLYEMTGTSGTTQFLYDGDALVGEYLNQPYNMTMRYVHGSAAGGDAPLIWYSPSMLHYLHRDHQGSIAGIADSAGTAIAINAYDEWGMPNAGNLGRFQYTGQIWLPELGMYHYKARMYVPGLGRFMQADPVGYEDQINLYAYGGNDPVNATDPTGMYICGSCSGFSSDGLLWDRDRRDLPGPRTFSSGGDNGVGGGHSQGPLNEPFRAYDPVSIAISALTLGEYSPQEIRQHVADFFRNPLRNLSEVSAAFPGGRAAGSGVRALTSATRSAGFVTNARFGAAVGWGSGRAAAAQARAAIGRIDRAAVARMREQGVTRELVTGWRNQYRSAASAGRGGPVAPARADLMDAILRNW